MEETLLIDRPITWRTVTEEGYFERVSEGPIPAAIIERNQGVGIEGMRDLLTYFERTDNGIPALVPVAAAADNAMDVYVQRCLPRFRSSWSSVSVKKPSYRS